MTSPLRDVAAVFLRLGILGFGGPTAHIALIIVGLPTVPATQCRRAPYRCRHLMSAFLDAVNVASVVLILYVCYLIGVDALVDWCTTIIAIASLAALLYFRNLNSALLILFGAIAGYLLY